MSVPFGFFIGFHPSPCVVDYPFFLVREGCWESHSAFGWSRRKQCVRSKTACKSQHRKRKKRTTEFMIHNPTKKTDPISTRAPVVFSEGKEDEKREKEKSEGASSVLVFLFAFNLQPATKRDKKRTRKKKKAKLLDRRKELSSSPWEGGLQDVCCCWCIPWWKLWIRKKTQAFFVDAQIVGFWKKKEDMQREGKKNGKKRNRKGGRIWVLTLEGGMDCFEFLKSVICHGGEWFSFHGCALRLVSMWMMKRYGTKVLLALGGIHRILTL